MKPNLRKTKNTRLQEDGRQEGGDGKTASKGHDNDTSQAGGALENGHENPSAVQEQTWLQKSAYTIDRPGTDPFSFLFLL